MTLQRSQEAYATYEQKLACWSGHCPIAGGVRPNCNLPSTAIRWATPLTPWVPGGGLAHRQPADETSLLGRESGRRQAGAVNARRDAASLLLAALFLLLRQPPQPHMPATTTAKPNNKRHRQAAAARMCWFSGWA